MENNTFLKLNQFSLKNSFLFSVYGICFLYLIFQDAIYTPDTISHFRMEVYRSPLYSSFVVVFKYLFKSYFDIVTVAFQLILGFTAVHLFYKKISVLLRLPIVMNLVLLIMLLQPFFNPLMVANNICSEGFSYPLYLLTLCFGFSFLYENKNFWLLFATSMLLSLTRAQFILLPIMIAIIYVIKYWKVIRSKKHSIAVALLIGLFFINILIDKTYHKITKNQFASTSSFFIANTAAIYVSKASDIEDLKDKEVKAIFKLSRSYSEENGWLMQKQNKQTFPELYNDFHSKLTRICSYSFHYKGSDYLKNTKGYTIDKARVQVEKAAKNMMPILVKNNFKDYIKLYYGNLIHGIKSQLLFFVIVGLFFFSLFKIFKYYSDEFSKLFLLSSLALSNMLIVSFGSYSIMRLLFYHYSLIVLLLFFSLRLLYNKYKKSD